jgi:hypothetical protein
MLITVCTVVQGHSPRCCRWYRPAAVAALEAQPASLQALALRYPPSSRYAVTACINIVYMFLRRSHRCRCRHWPHQHQERGTRHHPPPPTSCPADAPQVTGHEATPSGLADALKGAEIVVIPAGVPRKPGMTRDGAHTQWLQRAAHADTPQTCSTPTPPSSATWPRPPLSTRPRPTS